LELTAAEDGSFCVFFAEMGGSFCLDFGFGIGSFFYFFYSFLFVLLSETSTSLCKKPSILLLFFVLTAIGLL